MPFKFCQVSIIIPFVSSVIIWGETPGLTSWCGVGCILASIALFARKYSPADNPSHNRLWLPLAFFTFLICGLTQLLMCIAPHWADWTDSAHVRVPILLTAGTIVHVLIMFIKKIRIAPRMLPLCLAWTIQALVSFLLLFKCLDIMAKFGLVGIIYPLAVGTSIAGFSIYSHIHLREMYTRTTMAGLSVAIIGVILIAWR